MKEFAKLIRRLKLQRKYVILLILRSPFDAVRTCMLANLMKLVFVCVEGKDANRLLETCVIFCLICGGLFCYNGAVWGKYAAFAARTEAKLQKRVFQKMKELPLCKLENRFSGEWLTNMNSDIRTAFDLMNAPLNIPHLVVSIINTLLALCLILKGNWLFVLMVCLFMIPHIVSNYFLVMKHAAALKEKAQNDLAQITSNIMPFITEAETVLVYDAGPLLMKQFEDSSRRLMNTNLKLHMRTAVGGVLLRLFGIGGYFALVILGYYYIDSNIMTFSELAYYLQIRGSLLSAILMMLTCCNNIKANLVCVKRLNRILDE